MFEGLQRKNFEKKTVYMMIEIYCHKHHGTKKGLCEECQALYDYTVLKYDKCPFGAGKPVCSKCKVHCYKPQKREQIKEIMRYSGARMLFRHPIHTIVYFYHKWTIKAPDRVPHRKKIEEQYAKE
jgi:hypothetical protein